jgi:hypothetical protein
MPSATVKRLATTTEGPAVSIVCPLDRHAPGNARDPRALAALRNEASERLEARVGREVAADLVRQIGEAVERVDLRHPTAGVAIFVGPEVAEVVALHIPVAPRVVVGSSFALRELIESEAHDLRTRVLVLSQASTRCVEIDGSEATERRDHGFPVEVAPPTEADTPHRDFPLDEHEPDEAAKYVFRQVQRALAGLHRLDPRPLVLVGTERDLAYFDEVMTANGDVIARVHGNHNRQAAHDVARLVAPAVAQHLRAWEEAASRDAREANTVSAVTGLSEVWRAAFAGRGRRLVVERGFSLAAIVDGDEFEPARPDEPAATDVVDAVIGAVIRFDGEVVVVPDESLTDLGRIALFVRY